MEKPESLTFDGLEIPVQLLERKVRYSMGPMDPDWTRTQFAVPDSFTAPQAVHKWLDENCPGVWASYHYSDPKGKGDYVMVVSFCDKNDALMFKLRDGHKAWDQS